MTVKCSCSGLLGRVWRRRVAAGFCFFLFRFLFLFLVVVVVVAQEEQREHPQDAADGDSDGFTLQERKKMIWLTNLLKCWNYRALQKSCSWVKVETNTLWVVFCIDSRLQIWCVFSGECISAAGAASLSFYLQMHRFDLSPLSADCWHRLCCQSHPSHPSLLLNVSTAADSPSFSTFFYSFMSYSCVSTNLLSVWYSLNST